MEQQEMHLYMTTSISLAYYDLGNSLGALHCVLYLPRGLRETIYQGARVSVSHDTHCSEFPVSIRVLQGFPLTRFCSDTKRNGFQLTCLSVVETTKTAELDCAYQMLISVR